MTRNPTFHQNARETPAMMDKSKRFHKNHPRTWIDYSDNIHRLPPGMAVAGGRLFERVVHDDGDVTFWECDDEEQTRETRVPEFLTWNRGNITPDRLLELIKAYEQATCEHIRSAYDAGKLEGREEIKDVLRDLVGERTAGNV